MVNKKKPLKIYNSLVKDKQIGKLSDLNKYIENIAVEMYNKGTTSNYEDFVLKAKRAYCNSCVIKRSCSIKYSCESYNRFSKYLSNNNHK